MRVDDYDIDRVSRYRPRVQDERILSRLIQTRADWETTQALMRILERRKQRKEMQQHGRRAS